MKPYTFVTLLGPLISISRAQVNFFFCPLHSHALLLHFFHLHPRHASVPQPAIQSLQHAHVTFHTTSSVLHPPCNVASYWPHTRTGKSPSNKSHNVPVYHPGNAKNIYRGQEDFFLVFYCTVASQAIILK